MDARLTDLSGYADEVAPRLLGATVRHAGVAVRLTEVEAYRGEADPASHAARGRTPRNAVMYGPAGFWYVYFVYGMHWCANVVTGPEGLATAVLLRAGEVVDGLELARIRRPGVRDRDLARGPARLASALGLDSAGTGKPVDLTAGPPLPAEAIRSGPRVGVAVAAEVPWRFWIDHDPTVSPYRPWVPRRRTPGKAATAVSGRRPADGTG